MPERTVALRRDNTANERLPVQSQGARRYHRPTFNGIKPDEVASIINQLEDGRTERWVDLVEYMLRDPHVRSVETTRMTAIVGSDIVVEAGVAREGEEELAERAAQDFREELDTVDELESLLTGLLHAENVGWAGAEHEWKRVQGRWHSDPWVIPHRDVSFRNDWVPVVRSYVPPERIDYVQIQSDEHPSSRWMWHIPRKLGTPTTGGDFLAIVWHWLFKKWTTLFRNEAVEQLGAPFRVAMIAAGAPAEARQSLEAMFENQSNLHYAIVEEGTKLELIQPTGNVGSAHNEVIREIHDEITKAQLGSTLNVEVGTTGGNRALGESQAKMTMLPRLSAMAHRLETTLERQWARPWCKLNAHLLYGGRVPPTPRVRFQLVNEEPQPISELAVLAGVVTVDELREANGLQAWGPERGGDLPAKVAQRSPQLPGGGTPSSPSSPAGGPGDLAPFARRRPQPQPTPRTSGTSLDYRSTIAHAPFVKSDDPEP